MNASTIVGRPNGHHRITAPSQKISSGLRSVAMRAAALSVGATVLLTAAVAVSADALSTHPYARQHAAAAGPSALDHAVTLLKPYAYWPLNTGASPETDASGNDRPGLTTAGHGGAVSLGSSSHPAGGSGGSIAFNPSSQRSGQYLRSVLQPLPAGTIGTVIVWFKLSRTLPGWRQTLIADNGAATGWGGGIFISPGGRLSTQETEQPYPPANFGPRPSTLSAPLNDGRWHMVAFVDQYNIDTGGGPPSSWLPSLVYLDGSLVGNRGEGRMLDGWAVPKSRLLLGVTTRTDQPRLGWFKGNVADVALFPRLLSAANIQSVWAAGS